MEFERMAGHFIRRLHQHATQVFQSRMQETGLGLTSVQFAALAALRTHPGVDQASLAALIGYDRATIGGVVDRLEAKGLLARDISPQDRRARVLTLTPAGQQTVAEALPVVEALQDDILARLEPAERALFVDMARRALGIEANEVST